jgi:hypothetical protein
MQVSFIALRNKDGTILLDIPLYVQVGDIAKSGVSAGIDELLHRVSAVMTRRYEKQISEHFTNLKKGENEQ